MFGQVGLWSGSNRREIPSDKVGTFGGFARNDDWRRIGLIDDNLLWSEGFVRCEMLAKELLGGARIFGE